MAAHSTLYHGSDGEDLSRGEAEREMLSTFGIHLDMITQHTLQ